MDVPERGSGEISVEPTDAPKNILRVEIFQNGQAYRLIMRNPSDSSEGVGIPHSQGYVTREVAEEYARRLFHFLNSSGLCRQNPDYVFAQFASNPSLGWRAIESFIDAPTPAEPSTNAAERTIAPCDQKSSSSQEPEHECPICMEPVMQSGAVRCNSDPCHYFHNACLGNWISVMSNRTIPTCPMCRQDISIDAQALQEYMNDPRSSTELTDEDRQRLRYLLDQRIGRMETFRAATRDLKLIMNVPINICYGVVYGFDSLTQEQNRTTDDGIRMMRSFMRVAYRLLEDDAQTYPTSPWRPHSYIISWFRRHRKSLLDWTFTRIQETEEELSDARELDIEYAQRITDDGNSDPNEGNGNEITRRPRMQFRFGGLRLWSR